MSLLRPLVAAALTSMSLVAAACGQQEPQVRTVEVEGVGRVTLRAAGAGLEHPWGLAFLPDGRMLVTERPGRLQLLTADGTRASEIHGVPDVFARGQGGLLDVALHPDFEQNGLVYLSYAKPRDDGFATTALGRGKLVDDRLESFEDVFVQTPWFEGENHFGSRILFHDGSLWFGMGERFEFDPSQDLSTTLGKVVRLTYDGEPAPGNPFENEPGANPAVWSYGHRNIEAMAVDPATDNLWVVEFGPRGGDELNHVEPGKNFGWPLVSYGDDYDGTPRRRPTEMPQFDNAAHVWTPVISPSGATFYTGTQFGPWRGKLLVGGLSSRALVVIALDGTEYAGEQRVSMPGRVRDVAQGPDGNIYLITDEGNGDLYRLEPAE